MQTPSGLTLELLPLDQPKTGYQQFISAWLLRHAGAALVVDPGPTRSIPALVAQLRARGVEELDGILLTHIHIDHAGGTGDLLQELPTGFVHCHERARKHLIDPTRLWEGTQKVLGALAQFYGPIQAVDEALLRTDAEFVAGDLSIEVLPTPGHAPHHQSFLVGDYLFAGEAAGVHYPHPDGPYLRPATPPRFQQDVFFASLQRLREHPRLPENICYGHFGMLPQARQQLERAEAQLTLWCEQIEAKRAETEDAIVAHLQEQDPAFALYASLPAEIQVRERYFVGNSIKGIRGALPDA